MRSLLLLFTQNPFPLILPTVPPFTLGTPRLCHVFLEWLTPFPWESKATHVSKLGNKHSLFLEHHGWFGTNIRPKGVPWESTLELLVELSGKINFLFTIQGTKAVRRTHGATRTTFATLTGELSWTYTKKSKVKGLLGRGDWTPTSCYLGISIYSLDFSVMWANNFFSVGFCHLPLKVMANISLLCFREIPLYIHACLLHHKLPESKKCASPHGSTQHILSRTNLSELIWIQWRK